MVAIASARRETPKKLRGIHIEHVRANWRALVALDDIDLSASFPRSPTHFEILGSADQGKAVLCEKRWPMKCR